VVTEQPWSDRLAGLDDDAALRQVRDVVLTQVGVVLGHAAGRTPEATQAFKDLGFDSLTAVDLRNRLTAIFHIPLPASLVFDYPTPAILAEHVTERLRPKRSETAQFLIGELSRLAKDISLITNDDEVEQAFSDQLRDVLARLTERRAEPATAGVSEQLKAASDDEILDFISKEFGIS
jgi:acyl carrier protein